MHHSGELNALKEKKTTVGHTLHTERQRGGNAYAVDKTKSEHEQGIITAVKASSVDRNFSLSKLSKRLGEFKPGYYSERTFHKPSPEPVSHVCREEWQEYQKERQRLAEEKRLARKKREEEREELEQRQRERREAATARLASHGLSVLNITRHCLKEQEREEKAALNRQVQPEQAQRFPHFKHWLGKRNPSLANLWRFRKRIAPGVEVRKRKLPKTGTLTSPYAAYREMVKKRFSEKMDESRLDAAIALYMHCAGYTQCRRSPTSCTDTPPAAPAARAPMKGQSTGAE